MARILIVDDDVTLALAMSLRLQAVGFEVHTAGGANDASRLTLRERPDLIILDVEMPSYTGLEFHECLQMTERAREIPVVYVSGHDDPTTRLVAHQLGARAFLTKPCESQKLIATVHEVLGSAAAPTA